MPHVLDPNASKPGVDAELRRSNHNYTYELGKNLRPGSPFHDKLRERIMRRIRESDNIMSEKRKEWRNIDKMLKAYVRPESVRQNEGTTKKPTITQVIMPISYAALETNLTYMFSAFMQPPVFRYEGSGPEDTFGSMMMQEVVAHHFHRHAVGLGLHTAFRDSFAYGLGPAVAGWKRQFGRKVIKKEFAFMDFFLNKVKGTEFEKDLSDYEVQYEGNELVNIDPYCYFPDPNVSVHKPQEAEFQGWGERESYGALLKREAHGHDGLFNVLYLKHVDGRSTILTTDRDNSDKERRITSNKPVDVLYLYVDLIPYDWELSPSQLPEKWVFAVAGDKIVIMAQPANHVHGEYPLAVAAPDFDGYTVIPPSRLGLVHDLQLMVNFLYTSRIADIKRGVNGAFIYDPSIINTYDLKDPGEGMMVRTRRQSWGRPGAVKESFAQIPYIDATGRNVEESMFLTDMVNKTTGSTDPLAGVLHHKGPRISADASSGARSSGLSRYEKTAQVIAMQFMNPIGYMFAHNVQQFMDEDMYIKVTGEFGERLKKDFGADVRNGHVLVDPLDLIVNYDLKPYTATIPGTQDVQTWLQLFQTLAQQPIIAQDFEMTQIFKHMAHQMGAKNIDDFVKAPQQQPPQVQEDGQVEQQVQQGNLVPQNGQF